ncbi:hypothetical protein LP414_00475 [Polaromonas sp. P1(28)-13]|nr:hypothetical protein LP414_00475 [Polaromonas sp. P1(28)-13]
MTNVAQQAVLALACLTASAAFAQSQPMTAEFSELVKSLLVPVGSVSAPPDWCLSAHPALRWKSLTPQPPEAYMARDGLSMARSAWHHADSLTLRDRIALFLIADCAHSLWARSQNQLKNPPTHLARPAADQTAQQA